MRFMNGLKLFESGKCKENNLSVEVSFVILVFLMKLTFDGQMCVVRKDNLY